MSSADRSRDARIARGEGWKMEPGYKDRAWSPSGLWLPLPPYSTDLNIAMEAAVKAGLVSVRRVGVSSGEAWIAESAHYFSYFQSTPLLAVVDWLDEAIGRDE